MRGLERQRARDVHALLLAAGQLVRIARAEQVGVQTRPSRAGRAPRFRASARDMPCTFGPKAIESSHGQARIERGVAVLEHHLHVAAQLAQREPAAPRPRPRRRRSARRHRAGSGACSRRASVDLPQPDSPTMPSVSPLSTTNDTSSTARTLPIFRLNRPPRMGKCLLRSRDDQHRLDLAAAVARIAGRHRLELRALPGRAASLPWPFASTHMRRPWPGAARR